MLKQFMFSMLRYVRFIYWFLFFKEVHECYAFVNAHSSMPERVLQTEFQFNIMYRNSALREACFNVINQRFIK